jgi:hypothetical protein
MKIIKTLFTGPAEIGVERGGCASLFIVITLIGVLTAFVVFTVLELIIGAFS